MVMFNDGRASVLTFQFSLGTVLSNHSAWQVKYHITQWASISAKIPIFQNLRGFMEKSTRASMCNCLPICRSFFSLFHIACLGSILLFLVIAQLCPLIYCIRNLSAVACTRSFFAKENFSEKFLGVILSKLYALRLWILAYISFTLEEPDSWVERSGHDKKNIVQNIYQVTSYSLKRSSNRTLDFYLIPTLLESKSNTRKARKKPIISLKRAVLASRFVFFDVLMYKISQVIHLNEVKIGVYPCSSAPPLGI